jgi:hypothetical protein
MDSFIQIIVAAAEAVIIGSSVGNFPKCIHPLPLLILRPEGGMIHVYRYTRNV